MSLFLLFFFGSLPLRSSNSTQLLRYNYKSNCTGDAFLLYLFDLVQNLVFVGTLTRDNVYDDDTNSRNIKKNNQKCHFKPTLIYETNMVECSPH